MTTQHSGHQFRPSALGGIPCLGKMGGKGRAGSGETVVSGGGCEANWDEGRRGGLALGVLSGLPNPPAAQGGRSPRTLLAQGDRPP